MNRLWQKRLQCCLPLKVNEIVIMQIGQLDRNCPYDGSNVPWFIPIDKPVFSNHFVVIYRGGMCLFTITLPVILVVSAGEEKSVYVSQLMKGIF